MKLSRPNFGICRIDQPEKHNHGWFVRLTLKGEITSKFFADKSHHGKLAALAEARHHRDSLVKKLPKTRIEALARRRRHVKKSGYKGVTHVRTLSRSGQKYEYWQAAWNGDDNRRHSAKFSISTHGEKKALSLAKKYLVELGLPLEPRGLASPLKNKKESRR